MSGMLIPTLTATVILWIFRFWPGEAPQCHVVDVGGLRGYMWFLGRRLYLKLGWRPRDTVFLGNLSDPLAVAERLRRLLPRPVDERGCCPPPLALALDISIIYAKARPAALREPEFLTRYVVLTAKCWGSYGGMGSVKSRGESTR